VAGVDTVSWTGRDPGALVDRAERLLSRPGRSVLGIAGAPASGKSTLAQALLVELSHRHPDEVQLVGMDAFHLGHQVLVRHALVEVKGAPHTFDPHGFAALLQRIRAADVTVYAPEFHREIEDSLAQAVEVRPEVRLVITEGNYLLLPRPPWDRVRAALDEAWFVHLDDEVRRRRMARRHQSYGRTPEQAWARTLGSDEDNARLVNSAPAGVDLWIEQAG
jgi:pantothenate kinase